MEKQQHGFTLIELITVMLLVGILSAVAFSRFADNSLYTHALFSSKAQAYIRLAQQIAMAQQTPLSDSTSISFSKTSDSLWAIKISSLQGELHYQLESHEDLLLNETTITQNNDLTFYFDANGDITEHTRHLNTNDSRHTFSHSVALHIGTQTFCIVPTGYTYDGNCI